MGAPRKHKFDTRWLCTRMEDSSAVADVFDDAEPKPRLTLVPVEPLNAENELEQAGTQRLLAAMAAAHASEAQTRRSPWL